MTGAGLVRNFLGQINTITAAVLATLAGSGGSALVGYLQAGAGAVARTVQSKLQEAKSPEDFGALGNGVADDSAAFVAALAASAVVRCSPGKTYVVGDVSIPQNSTLDLNGAILKRKAGAKHTLILASYRPALFNGELQGGTWFASTATAAAFTGGFTLTLATVAGLAAGMRCFIPSTWADGGIETNEVDSIAGNVVTLRKALLGNVANGANFVADFPLLKVAGAALYAPTVRGLFIRNFCVGLASGENKVAGSASFADVSGIFFEDFIGAACVMAGNNAAEGFHKLRANGGKTQVANYAGTGARVRFPIPYYLARKVYRWGAEPSVRLLVNGAQLATGNYTVDLATMEVVANVAPVNGAAVQVQNYEYAAYGIVGQNIAATQPSSVERLSDSLMLACNIGQFYDNCILGFFSNVQSDTAGYCATLVRGGGDMQLRACDHLYSPFGIILDGVSNCAVADMSTSLVPDADEFTPTAGKKELIVRGGSSNVQVDYTSWASKNSYTRSVEPGSRAIGAPVQVVGEGIAVGGGVSGRLALYGVAVNKYMQVDDNADIFMGGAAGQVHRVHCTAQNGVLQVGAVGPGGGTQFVDNTGVARLQIDSAGHLMTSVPTSAAGLTSGCVWSNAGVLTLVP